MIVNILLFDDFETLDAFGPVEVFGKLPIDYTLKFLSLNGGIIKSRQGSPINTSSISEFSEGNILVIPGGQGVRPLVKNESYVHMVKTLCENSRYCLTVCTGSALLAKTGLLKGLNATSNKLAFEWVISVDPEVTWLKKARWAVDGKYWTSSGVSAGIDMSLAFVEEINGRDNSIQIAKVMEYIWNEDKDNDPFCIE